MGKRRIAGNGGERGSVVSRRGSGQSSTPGALHSGKGGGVSAGIEGGITGEEE